MDGSRTHHGSPRDPTTDFEDREAHRDLTIPTVKHNQPPLGCQPFGLFSGLFTIGFFCGGLSGILPSAIGHDLGDQVQREGLVEREAHGAFA